VLRPVLVVLLLALSGCYGAYVYDRCQPGFRRFLGADASLALCTTLSWARTEQ
jgi:hypothetical protein